MTQGVAFLSQPRGVAVEASGNITVTETSGPGGSGIVLRVDPITGNRTTVSDFNGGGVGAGDVCVGCGFLSKLEVEESGDIIVISVIEKNRITLDV